MKIRILLISALFLFLSGCGAHRAGYEPPIPKHQLTKWHKPFRRADAWRLTARGVELKNGGIERTPGPPKTASWIWESYYEPINTWSGHYLVPAELIIAIIATEARALPNQPAFTRDPNSIRREPGFVSAEATPHKISVGLMQMTIATARAVMSQEGMNTADVNDAWLLVPTNAIRAGTAMLALQARGRMCNVATMLDPPVAVAAYHAGGLYHMGGYHNRWKMRQYPAKSGRHLDRAVRFFNDAVEALRRHPTRPAYGYRDYLYAPPRWPLTFVDETIELCLEEFSCG